MLISATCSCGKSFQAKPEFAGKTVRCSACGSAFQIPAAAIAPAPVADPPNNLATSKAQFPAKSFSTQAANAHGQQNPFGQPYAAAPRTQTSNQGLIIGLVVGGVGLGAFLLIVVLLALLLPAIQAAREAARKQAAQNAFPSETSTNAGETTSNAGNNTPRTSAASSSASQWRTYTSQSGKYSVDMPGTPLSRMQPAPGGIMVSIALLEITKQQACAVKHIRILAHQSGSIDIEGGFAGGRQAELKSLNGTLISEKEIKLGDIPGREILLRGSIGNVKMVKTIHMYITSDMIYSVEWISADGQQSTDDSQRFLNSFKLTDAKSPTVATVAEANATDNPFRAATGSPSATAKPPKGSADGPDSGAKLELTEQRRKNIYKGIIAPEAGFAASEKQANDLAAKGQADIAARLREQTERTRRTHRENMKRIWKLSQAEFDQILAEGKQQGW